MFTLLVAGLFAANHRMILLLLLAADLLMRPLNRCKTFALPLSLSLRSEASEACEIRLRRRRVRDAPATNNKLLRTNERADGRMDE